MDAIEPRRSRRRHRSVRNGNSSGHFIKHSEVSHRQATIRRSSSFIVVMISMLSWIGLSELFTLGRNGSSPSSFTLTRTISSAVAYEAHSRHRRLAVTTTKVPPDNKRSNSRKDEWKLHYRDEGMPPHTHNEIEKPISESSLSFSTLWSQTISSTLSHRNLLPKCTIRTVDELRSAILDDQLSLRETHIDNYIVNPIDAGLRLQSPPPSPSTTPNIYSTDTNATVSTNTMNPFQDHAVHNLIAERYRSGSTPGQRQDGDNSTLALAIEGGGMRGCVSAGMAAAITALGLTDTIDVVYGSSAGSVVGAYLVSRQVCMDVYVDILPAAKKKFVCKRRMARSIATSLVEVIARGMRRASNFRNQLKYSPGMNISFVLDGIMGQDHGIRPLDVDKFEYNNKRQPLKVVSSCIDPTSGKLFSKTFGTDDFFAHTAVKKADGSREGLFACLEASMTVPGATGPPVNLRYTHSTNDSNLDNDKSSTPSSKTFPKEALDLESVPPSSILPCFDAFCFEPIPYRSAVEDGATHVLILCSRPEGYRMKTKPGLYEKGVAPLYFHSHGHPEVAEFFEEGGQQYIYAEDLLTLEQAKTAPPSSDGVLVGPPRITYGIPRTPKTDDDIENRESKWKRAHLMPIKVPQNHKELPTLEQDKGAVLEAVRGGFASAFDSLSSIVGMDHIKGEEAALLLFPDEVSDQATESEQVDVLTRDEMILQTKIHVPGETISNQIQSENSFHPYKNAVSPEHQSQWFDPLAMHQNEMDPSESLLLTLPGFQHGRFRHLLDPKSAIQV